MIDGKNFLISQLKVNMRTNNNIIKIIKRKQQVKEVVTQLLVC